MVGDESLEDFADGLPCEVAGRLNQIETAAEVRALGDAPARLKDIARAVGDNKVPMDYWSEDSGVVRAFYPGDGPRAGAISYWHANEKGFQEEKRVEAREFLDWLDKYLPQLAKRQHEDRIQS